MVEAALGVERAGPALAECHDCGLRHRMNLLPKGAVARCGRCGATLRTRSSLDFCLALAVTGLVLILLANFMPFMSLHMEGRAEDASLASGALTLAGEGLWPLTVLILLLTIVMPAVEARRDDLRAAGAQARAGRRTISLPCCAGSTGFIRGR